MMSYSIVRSMVLGLGVLAAAVSAVGAENAAAPIQAGQPQQGIVILRNGQIIEGRIAQTDGLWIVDLPDGQIRLKATDVDVVCRSLEEGYQRKRALIQVGNVHDHLELAQWCLRHDLWGPAAAELADATTAEPNNPMIAALQRRLKMAVEPQSSADGPGNPTVGPTNDDLDRMIRGLPHGAVETFTQLVQPVLMNHCATSGCHGPQSETGLRLFRTSGNQLASRRITQRNLYSVLQFIDLETPQSSRLLTAPSGPHGTARYAIFNEHQASQYRRMADWANQLAHQPEQEVPSTVTPPAVVEPPAPLVAAGVLPQEAGKARQLPGAGQNPTARRGAVRPAARSTGDATPASYNEPADPHDPEIFNRRYAPEKKE
jgi:hypothetical protein